MTEPRRLCDESKDAWERAIVRSGLSEQPRPGMHGRLLTALGAGGIAATTVGAAAAAAAAGRKVAVWSVAKWLGAGVLTGTLTVGAIKAVEVASPSGQLWSAPAQSTPRPQHARAPQPLRLPETSSASAPALTPDPVPPPRDDSTAVRGVESTNRAAEPVDSVTTAAAALAVELTTSPIAPTSSVPVAPVPSSFAAEMALLDSAREALGRGDAPAALALLDRRDQQYPSGLLGQEAEVLRIEALLRKGQGTEARRRAGRFLQTNPNSTYSARVRGLVKK